MLFGAGAGFNPLGLAAEQKAAVVSQVVETGLWLSIRLHGAVGWLPMREQLPVVPLDAPPAVAASAPRERVLAVVEFIASRVAQLEGAESPLHACVELAAGSLLASEKYLQDPQLVAQYGAGQDIAAGLLTLYPLVFTCCPSPEGRMTPHKAASLALMWKLGTRPPAFPHNFTPGLRELWSLNLAQKRNATLWQSVGSGEPALDQQEVRNRAAMAFRNAATDVTTLKPAAAASAPPAPGSMLHAAPAMLAASQLPLARAPVVMPPGAAAGGAAATTATESWVEHPRMPTFTATRIGTSRASTDVCNNPKWLSALVGAEKQVTSDCSRFAARVRSRSHGTHVDLVRARFDVLRNDVLGMSRKLIEAAMVALAWHRRAVDAMKEQQQIQDAATEETNAIDAKLKGISKEAGELRDALRNAKFQKNTAEQARINSELKKLQNIEAELNAKWHAATDAAAEKRPICDTVVAKAEAVEQELAAMRWRLSMHYAEWDALRLVLKTAGESDSDVMLLPQAAFHVTQVNTKPGAVASLCDMREATVHTARYNAIWKGLEATDAPLLSAASERVATPAATAPNSGNSTHSAAQRTNSLEPVIPFELPDSQDAAAASASDEAALEDVRSRAIASKAQKAAAAQEVEAAREAAAAAAAARKLSQADSTGVGGPADPRKAVAASRSTLSASGTAAADPVLAPLPLPAALPLILPAATEEAAPAARAARAAPTPMASAPDVATAATASAHDSKLAALYMQKEALLARATSSSTAGSGGGSPPAEAPAQRSAIIPHKGVAGFSASSLVPAPASPASHKSNKAVDSKAVNIVHPSPAPATVQEAEAAARRALGGPNVSVPLMPLTITKASSSSSTSLSAASAKVFMPGPSASTVAAADERAEVLSTTSREFAAALAEAKQSRAAEPLPRLSGVKRKAEDAIANLHTAAIVAQAEEDSATSKHDKQEKKAANDKKEKKEKKDKLKTADKEEAEEKVKEKPTKANHTAGNGERAAVTAVAAANVHKKVALSPSATESPAAAPAPVPDITPPRIRLTASITTMLSFVGATLEEWVAPRGLDPREAPARDLHGSMLPVWPGSDIYY